MWLTIQGLNALFLGPFDIPSIFLHLWQWKLDGWGRRICQKIRFHITNGQLLLGLGLSSNFSILLWWRMKMWRMKTGTRYQWPHQIWEIRSLCQWNPPVKISYPTCRESTFNVGPSQHSFRFINSLTLLQNINTICKTGRPIK